MCVYKWEPTPVFLPGKSHGSWSLVGYHPWGHKESDTTEWLHFTSEELKSRSEQAEKETAHLRPYHWNSKKHKGKKKKKISVQSLSRKEFCDCVWWWMLTRLIVIILQYKWIVNPWMLVAQLCPTLCNPMDYSPPGSSVHGVFQARILE